MGADSDRIEGAGGASSSTLIAGAGNDTLTFTGGLTSASILGGAGDDSFNTTKLFTSTTLLGGDGADTASFTGQISSGYIDMGAGVSLVSASAGIHGSTLLGGAAADTLNLYGVGSTGTRFIMGGGGDTLTFGGDELHAKLSSASVKGGAGNDSYLVLEPSGQKLLPRPISSVQTMEMTPFPSHLPHRCCRYLT